MVKKTRLPACGCKNYCLPAVLRRGDSTIQTGKMPVLQNKGPPGVWAEETSLIPPYGEHSIILIFVVFLMNKRAECVM